MPWARFSRPHCATNSGTRHDVRRHCPPPHRAPRRARRRAHLRRVPRAPGPGGVRGRVRPGQPAQRRARLPHRRHRRAPPAADAGVRYPGGNFVSAYDWRHGVGPREQRPSRPDFAWRSIETNQFGTDEFIEWCDAIGTAPMMAVNLGTGTPAEAAAAARVLQPAGRDEHRGPAGRQRHVDPYGVELWCLGNEMDGFWQAGHVPARRYAERALVASRLMKGLDPTHRDDRLRQQLREPAHLPRVGPDGARALLGQHRLHLGPPLQPQPRATTPLRSWPKASSSTRRSTSTAGLLAYVRGRKRGTTTSSSASTSGTSGTNTAATAVALGPRTSSRSTTTSRTRSCARSS